MKQPTKDELLRGTEGAFDTNGLEFSGPRGDASKHLSKRELLRALAVLPKAPADVGAVDMMVARGPVGERALPAEVVLSVHGGMPGDRWAGDDRYDETYQLATAQTDYARLIGNGQPLELHGDNLFLTLDLSSDNLPVGSRLRLGQALVQVTPKAHNGCKKWVQRFGLAAMQLNLAPETRSLHLRGIYLRVIEPGRVRVGDVVTVFERGRA